MSKESESHRKGSDSEKRTLRLAAQPVDEYLRCVNGCKGLEGEALVACIKGCADVVVGPKATEATTDV